MTEWSAQHIRDIFEAPSDDEALRSISNTFSEGVDAMLNGKPLTREGIDQLVLAMRKSACRDGLKVRWKETVEVPRDPSTNRVGTLSSQISLADTA